jgi:hypothetical protein
MVARRNVQQAATKPVDSQNSEVNDLQRQVAELQRQFNPFARGEFLEWKQKVAFVTFTHKLGRKPDGIIPLNISIALTTDIPTVAIKSSDATTVTLGIRTLCDGKVWLF